MKKNLPIKLNITSPCNQNWEDMKCRTDGRHCDHCQKTVIDFSNMTDSQVYHFFSQHKDTHCGRFLTTQLQRDIVPLQTPSARVSRTNAFAAVITLVALNTAQVFGQKNNMQKQLVTKVENNKDKQPADKVTISGTLTNDSGNPLENATVFFDSLSTVTDKDGKFTIEIVNPNSEIHNLYFSFAGLNSAVRNYHRAMGSTTFEITLSKPQPVSNFRHTMGAPMLTTVEFPDFRLEASRI